MQKLKGTLGILSIGLLLVLSYGCSDFGETPTGPGPNGGGGGNTDTVSFVNDVRPTLVSSCALMNCHGSGITQSGLNMGGVSSSEIRNASGWNGPIVVAGDAGSSNLYLKTTFPPPFLSQMPFGGLPLSTQAQEAIRDWINQGALNN